MARYSFSDRRACSVFGAGIFSHTRPTVTVEFPVKGIVYARHIDCPEWVEMPNMFLPALDMDSPTFDMQAFQDQIRDTGNLVKTWVDPVTGLTLVAPFFAQNVEKHDHYVRFLRREAVSDNRLISYDMSREEFLKESEEIRYLLSNSAPVPLGDRAYHWEPCALEIYAEGDHLCFLGGLPVENCRHDFALHISLRFWGVAKANTGTSQKTFAGNGLIGLMAFLQENMGLDLYEALCKNPKYFFDGFVVRDKDRIQHIKRLGMGAVPFYTRKPTQVRRAYELDTNAFPVPSHMLHSTDEGSPYGDLMVLGLSRATTSLIPFRAAENEEEFLRDIAGTLGDAVSGWSIHQSVLDMAMSKPYWMSNKGRVFIHRAEDGFRFLFAMETALAVREPDVGPSVVPAFYCIPYFVPMTLRPLHRTAVFRGLGSDATAVVNQIPGLPTALQNAGEEIRAQKATLSNLGIDLRLNMAATLLMGLPKGHSICTSGLGASAVNEGDHMMRREGGNPQPWEALYRGTKRDSTKSIMLGNPRSRLLRRCTEVTPPRLREVVATTFSKMTLNLLTEARQVLSSELCTGLQRRVILDQEESIPVLDRVASPVAQRAWAFD